MSAITLSGFDKATATIHQSYYQLRESALAEAKAINKVESNGDLALAGEALKACKRIVADVEKSREAAKAPVLDLGREIDAAARGFCSEVVDHAQRLARLIGGYHARIEEAAREAQRVRQRELDRIAAEQRAAEEKARQEAKIAQTEAQLETAVAAQQAAKVEAAQQSKAVVMPPPPPPKIAGMSVRSVWKFEVTNINELHLCNPQFVTLVPKTSDINAAITAGARTIPGLRIWEEKEVRGTR